MRIFTEPQQGATYADLLRVAITAEDCGYDGFFRSDHLLPIGDADGFPGPTDAWTTLAGLARETTRIRLGTLVSPVTFRHPGMLAVQVAQVDDMSRGRVEVGLGAGWYPAEHAAYGIPYPETGERFDLLEESLEVLLGLWATPIGQRYDFAGRHLRISGSPALPKPAQQPHPPVIVGGMGRTRTPRLTARYADEFNVAFAAPEQTATCYERVRAACAHIGRDPQDLVYSVAQVVACATDEWSLRRRAAATGREVDELTASGLAGSPAQIVERLGEFAAVGVERVYLQVLDLGDLDQLEEIADLVLPQLAPSRGDLPAPPPHT